MLACSLILLGSLACLAVAHPIESDVEHQWTLVRERRSPMAARTMILVRGQPSGGGYHYERPERNFNPRAAMAAYATGGTVATGSFYGAPSQKQKCGECKQVAEEHPEPPKTDEESKAAEGTTPEEIPEGDIEKEVVPERRPKAPKPPKRRPVKDDDEDDDDDNDGSVYRNFFPMTFGAAGRGRLRAANDEDDAGQGGYGPVTAIANSFSKGRGAVASASAVAHGSPDAGQNKQSQQSRYRARA